MVSKVKQWIICSWDGHKWDQIHGFRNYPEPGAICLRCGAVFEDRLSSVI